MKTKSILSVSLVMLLVIGGASAWAQGRSRSNGPDNHHGNSKGSKGNAHHNNDRNDRNHHNNSKPQYSYHDHDRGHYDRRNDADCHDHRRVVHVYHPAPVERRVVHHYYRERPCYVYYRDYDVYYDRHSNVYIAFGGRNWSISAGIPVVMRHVDVRTVVTTDVDYYDDNFTAYLDTRRPGGRLYAEW